MVNASLGFALIDGRHIALSDKEARLLDILRRNQGHFTHARALADLIGTTAGAVGMFVKRLRQKMEFISDDIAAAVGIDNALEGIENLLFADHGAPAIRFWPRRFVPARCV